MQRTTFLLLSVSIALSLSNPIAERDQILNEGDVIAVFDADEPDQPAVLFAVQQTPLDDSVTLRSLTPEESKNEDDMTKNDCEGCDSETGIQERSFLFKKLLLSKFIRPIAVSAPVPAPPRPVAVPSAFLIGTVYQPTSFVAAPIRGTGSFTGGLSASGQASMALSLPSVRPLIQPSTGLATAGASFLGTGLAGQQLSQMLLGGGQSAAQTIAPSTGFSGISVGQGGSFSGQQMILAPVPQSSAGVQLAAPRPSMVTAPIDALAAQGARPTSGLFPNGQGNIGINIQQSGVSHSSSGPVPNSVANINISSAELPEVQTAESAETAGAPNPCSKC